MGANGILGKNAMQGVRINMQEKPNKMRSNKKRETNKKPQRREPRPPPPPGHGAGLHGGGAWPPAPCGRAGRTSACHPGRGRGNSSGGDPAAPMDGEGPRARMGVRYVAPPPGRVGAIEGWTIGDDLLWVLDWVAGSIVVLSPPEWRNLWGPVGPGNPVADGKTMAAVSSANAIAPVANQQHRNPTLRGWSRVPIMRQPMIKGPYGTPSTPRRPPRSPQRC